MASPYGVANASAFSGPRADAVGAPAGPAAPATMTKQPSLARRAVRTLALLLALLFGLLACSADRLFYHPSSAVYAAPAAYGLAGVEQVSFAAPEGPRLHGWWLPAVHGALSVDGDAPEAPSPRLACARSRAYVQLLNFGRTNNNLLAWAHALELVVAASPVDAPLTLVRAPEFEANTAPWFDWRGATAGWACVARRRDVPPNATLRTLHGSELLHLPLRLPRAQLALALPQHCLGDPLPDARTIRLGPVRVELPKVVAPAPQALRHL